MLEEFSVAIDLGEEINQAQMFRLMDTILPVEACVYHQILPLAVEGKYLKLGMVDLDDQEALAYVQRTLGYIHCTLLPRPLSVDLLQQKLTDYLRYTESRQPMFSQGAGGLGMGEDTQTTVIVRPEADQPDGSPQDVPGWENPLNPVGDDRLEDQENPGPVNLDHDRPQPGTPPPESAPAPQSPPWRRTPLAPPPIPRLDLQTYYLNQPIGVLMDLAPHNFLQELLGRALMGGIGRLYFEQEATYGRVLWSQSGVLQSALDPVDLYLYQGVIQELKGLVGWPLEPIAQGQQTEIERMYEGKRLLLRLRLAPGKYGEQGTLQVLRGVALKFYEQQRISRLERDTLQVAQQLQRKLAEMSHSSTAVGDTVAHMTLNSLEELNQLLESIKARIENL